jgi:plastocyanin
MRSTSLFAAALTLVLGLAVAGCATKDPASPAPAGGPRFNLTFPAAGPNGTSQHLQVNDIGTWNYACTPHAAQNMTGTIVVAASGPDSAYVEVDPQAHPFEFNPKTVTIKAGGHVRWQNQGTRTDHTVTR